MKIISTNAHENCALSMLNQLWTGLELTFQDLFSTIVDKHSQL